MVKNNKYICGTVKECVEEIWKMINWMEMRFPEFDFCGSCDIEELTEEELDTVKSPSELGSSWSGCKENFDFDSKGDSINLIFGYYGGGWFRSMCIEYEERNEKECIVNDMINIICDVADLKPDWETVFELIKGE